MTTIEYRGKGYFSGKSHSFKASIYAPLPLVTGASGPPTPSTTAKYVAEGTWTETSKLRQGGAPFTNVTGPKSEVEVSDVETQDPYETRNLWKDVARGIRTGDFELASREKSKIEVRFLFRPFRKPSKDLFYFRMRSDRSARMRRLQGHLGRSDTSNTLKMIPIVSSGSVSRSFVILTFCPQSKT